VKIFTAFAVLLPETSETGAMQCAEKIRKTIEETAMHDNTDKTFTIQTSCGIATYPDHGESIGNIIKNADVALYSAKNAGKNKSVIYRHPAGQGKENKV